MTYTTTTHVLKIDAASPEPEPLQRAADMLRAGGLVAFPTETVYGLGANALDNVAVGRIFAAKQRPNADPIIAHIHDRDQLTLLAREVPAIVAEIAAHFWPGPLTLVLKKAPRVPGILTADLDTVAVRMPAHPVARALLQTVALPIGAPSANTFTRPSPTTAAHVLEDLRGHVDIVLDGGTATIGLESTVLDLTQSPPVILRPGGVALEDLRAVLPAAVLAPRFLHLDESGAPAATSPGQLTRHYSPNATVMLFTGPTNAVLRRMRQAAQQRTLDGERIGLLVADEDAPYFSSLTDVVVLGPRDDLDAIARALFAGMRTLDRHGVAVIMTRDFGRDGLGAALWDRLLRAAEGRVIEVKAE